MRYLQCHDNLPAAAAISTMVVLAVGLVLGLRFHSNLVNTRKVTLSPSVEELWRSRFGNPERLSYKLIAQENIPDPFRNSCLATIDRFHQGQAITLTYNLSDLDRDQIAQWLRGTDPEFGLPKAGGSDAALEDGTSDGIYLTVKWYAKHRIYAVNSTRIH
jgi:hypothetical protein